jgi:glycopeptide antibiotics resistance protein
MGDINGKSGVIVILPISNWINSNQDMIAILFTLVILIEVMQLLLEKGTFELDDMFNNMLGTFIGVIIVGFIDFEYRRKEE